MDNHILEASPQAFFTYAEAYAASAQTLDDQKIYVAHAEAPVRMLWFHAIELYLKAFLGACGLSADRMSKRDLGHNLENLVSKAKAYDLKISPEDTKHLIEAYDSGAIFQSRYLEPAAPNLILFDNDLLANIAMRIRKAVVEHPVREGKILIAGERANRDFMNVR